MNPRAAGTVDVYRLHKIYYGTFLIPVIPTNEDVTFNFEKRVPLRIASGPASHYHPCHGACLVFSFVTCRIVCHA